MARTILAVAILFLLSGFSPTARADTPGLVNYQGMLKDDVGNYIIGAYDLTFKIYPSDLPTATALWTEVHYGVPVELGLFGISRGACAASALVR